MESLAAVPPAPQGFAQNETPQTRRDAARVSELYRERYGDPDDLDLERSRRAAARPALIPITPAEALAHLQQLVDAADGRPLRARVCVDTSRVNPFTIEGA